MDEVKKMAEYCLNCKTKPCVEKGCPMKTNIPEFIENIKNNDYKKAYDILAENNILSHICSIICPQEEQCEGSCVRGIKSLPTNIGKLEKFVNEWAIENNYKYEYKKQKENGFKVAIIGSGPAGLSCATELLKDGFKVDIYEKENVCGGILSYGIPDFRLSKDIVMDVIEKLKNLGANFILNKELGKDFYIKDLKEKYDAIFLGIGAPIATQYSLTEEETEGIYDSDYFLKAYNEKKYIKNLGTVIVIGGGNVAMDSARVALKMGAEKVKILYRRDRNHMPAREVELEETLNDGVEFKELVRVISANKENGKIVSVNCISTEIIDGKAVDKEYAEKFEEKADTAIFAIGLKPERKLIESQGIALDDCGYIKIDDNGMTSIDKVFAGGDVSEGKATVCVALASGKKAAIGIKGILS